MKGFVGFWLLLLNVACVSSATRQHVPASSEASNANRGSAERTSTVSSVRGRPPHSEEQHIIDQLTREAEHLRGLKWKHNVRVFIQSGEDMLSHVATQLSNEDLERMHVLYVGLGLLAPDADVRGLVTDVLSEQVLGYYDPDSQFLAIRDEVMQELLHPTPSERPASETMFESRMVLVHELVHALQDQHLGLGKAYRKQRTVDEENAFRALVEGDATLAMVGWLGERMGVRLDTLVSQGNTLRKLVYQGKSAKGGRLGHAPAILRVPLVSAYIDGMLFAASLYKNGGWRAVDAAFRSPPRSTAEVLHPGLYGKGHIPLALAGPVQSLAMTSGGYQFRFEDSLGELETGILLSKDTAVGAIAADRAAVGWLWDRARIYSDPYGRVSAIWYSVWQTVAQANAAGALAAATCEGVSPSFRSRCGSQVAGRSVMFYRWIAPEFQDDINGAFRTWAASLRLPQGGNAGGSRGRAVQRAKPL